MGGRDWYSWGGTRKSSTKKGAGVGRTSTNATSISGGMGGGGGGGGREEKETCSSSSSTTYFPYSSSSTTFSPSTATPVAGCMSAVFNLFDFQFCLHQQQHNGFHQPSYFPHEPTSSSSMKGVEAPRNSLETEEMVNGADNSLSSIREELEEREENFNIPMGIQINNNNNISNGRRDTSLLRIHTRSSKSKGDDTLSASGSSTSCSPGVSGGARTPSLVARLMGLDLLPEGSTPTGTHSAALCNNVTPRSSSSSSSLSNLRRHLHRKKSTSPPPQKTQQMSRTPGPTGSNKRKNKLCLVSSAGSQSLPETPRTSLARKSDVADYRRLGIQINKENNIHEEFEMSRRSCSAINTNSNVLKRTEKWRFQAFESETKSPRHYARQILKQVKESVSRRRAGVDITNTIHGQSNGDHRTRDENLTLSNNKSRKEDALTRSTVIANNSHSSAGKLNNSPSSDPFSPSQRLRFPESKTTKPAATAAPTTTTANDRGENHQQPCPPSPSSTISNLNNHDVEAKPTQPIESILNPMPSHSHSQPPPQPLPSSQSPLSQTDQEQHRNLKPKLTQNPRKINAIEVDHYHHPRFYSYSRVKKPHAAHQQAPHIDSIRNKKEEQFVHPSSIANRAANYINPDKKCRKTALSSDLLHVSVPSLVPVVKKDSSPLPSPTKLFVQRRKSEENPSTIIKAVAAQPSMPTTTAQLFSYNNLVPYENKESTLMPPIFPRKKRITEKDAAFADAVAAATASTASSSCGAEYQYISRILKRTGIDKYTPLVSFGQWYSPSHPLDPSIFDALEHTTSYDNENSCYTPITTLDSYSYKNATAPSSPSLGFRCNRKLIFHLVDEILSDILKLQLNSRPWMVSQLCSSSNTTRDQNRRMYGFQLVNTLCTKITSFPSAQCQVLQDIDDLIAKDLPSDFGVQNFSGAYEEEGEGIVTEIERDIVDSLVHELRHGC